MTKFYMVYRDGNYPPTKKHETLKSASDEMQRLAKKHPGENFYVLEAKMFLRSMFNRFSLFKK